jgi:hypothetical protein
MDWNLITDPGICSDNGLAWIKDKSLAMSFFSLFNRIKIDLRLTDLVCFLNGTWMFLGMIASFDKIGDLPNWIVIRAASQYTGLLPLDSKDPSPPKRPRIRPAIELYDGHKKAPVL